MIPWWIPGPRLIWAVGHDHYQDALAAAWHLPHPVTAALIPKTDNPHDPQAVAVAVGATVGHLPRKIAADYHAALVTLDTSGRRAVLPIWILGGTAEMQAGYVTLLTTIARPGELTTAPQPMATHGPPEILPARRAHDLTGCDRGALVAACAGRVPSLLCAALSVSGRTKRPPTVTVTATTGTIGHVAGSVAARLAPGVIDTLARGRTPNALTRIGRKKSGAIGARIWLPKGVYPPVDTRGRGL